MHFLGCVTDEEGFKTVSRQKRAGAFCLGDMPVTFTAGKSKSDTRQADFAVASSFRELIDDESELDPRGVDEISAQVQMVDAACLGRVPPNRLMKAGPKHAGHEHADTPFGED